MAVFGVGIKRLVGVVVLAAALYGTADGKAGQTASRACTGDPSFQSAVTFDALMVSRPISFRVSWTWNNQEKGDSWGIRVRLNEAYVPFNMYFLNRDIPRTHFVVKISLLDDPYRAGMDLDVSVELTNACGWKNQETYRRGSPGDTYKKLYVWASGDSFASGEANPPFTKEGGNCDRSKDAWPNLFATKSNTLAMLTNIACSGATTADLRKQFKGQPAQLDTLKEQQPDVILLMVGGNDLKFGHLLVDCFVLNCLSDKQYDTLQANIAKLEETLAALYQEIEELTPGAQLVVVGYPRIFPTDHADTYRCGWLTPSERTRFNDLAGKLDKAVAEAASHTGAIYISTLDALEGHELCTRDSWMYSIGKSGGNKRGHPLLAGQQAIADLVLRQLG